ncbi:zinc finger protein 773-like [Planococcus citri]|uniref:zinc finger protein 773-like n=1 Tax=Planococcus citri TaxID=170843 RepID=UPI0031F7F246
MSPLEISSDDDHSSEEGCMPSLGEGRITRDVKKKKELPSVATTIKTSDSVPKKVRGALNPDSPAYCCNICDKTFSKKWCWTRHQQRHLKLFHCQKCDKRFARKYDLVRHQATHTKTRPYKCDICDSRFKYDYDKLRHQRRMHAEVTYFECDICGKMFNYKSSIVDHLQVHSEAHEEHIDEDGQFPNLNARSSPQKLEDDGSCNAEVQYQKRFEDDPTSEDLRSCFSDPTKPTDYVFFNVVVDDNGVVSDISVNPQINYQLHRSASSANSNNEQFDKAHVGQTHRMEEVQVTTQLSNCNDELNVCQRNEQTFSSAGYSKPRENRVEGRITRCVKKKKELHSVSTTIQTSDSVPKKVRGVLMQDSPPYCCDICDETYSYKSCWTRHQRKHISKPFVCRMCKKPFARKYHLIRHRATHTEMKPYKCGICGARFKHDDNKLKHERYMHTEVACFECAVCGKMFNHKSSIINHLRVHSGQKPFRCQTCGTRFPLKGQLVSHQRMHSIEKKFKCRICDKLFKHQRDKTRHERLHEEGPRFECALCGKKYHQKHGLAYHINISRNCS